MSSKTLSSAVGLAAAVFAVCLALAPASLAAKGGTGATHKGGGGSTSSSAISLVVLNSPDGLPHWDGEVTFDVTSTVTSEPWVELTCYQDGLSVLVGWKGFFERSLTTQVFTLASNGWRGGAADCTAWLETPKGAKLVSTSFHVYE
jgi:hypothetical protein